MQEEISNYNNSRNVQGIKYGAIQTYSFARTFPRLALCTAFISILRAEAPRKGAITNTQIKEKENKMRLKKQLTGITGIAMLLSLIVATVSVAVQIPVLYAGNVPSPTTYLGLDPAGNLWGGNGTRTPWYKVVGYFLAVANSTASNRVRVYRFGYSDYGRPMIIGVITSPSNWAHMENNKAALNALYDPRITTPDQAQKLIQTTIPVVIVEASQHSGESGSVEMAMDLLYKLAASKDPDVTNILDNVIVIINPCENPDGHDMWVNYHYQWGAPNFGPGSQQFASGTPPMWSKYVNHDNNRDWDKGNLIENTNIMQVIMEWHPQVFEDHHESGPARIFTPPNPDVVNPNISPIGRMGWLMYGAHIDQQAATQNMPGYVSGFRTAYDMWYPGYGDSWPTFQGAYGMTFETNGASFDRSVSPQRGFEAGMGVSMSQALPWAGGSWTAMDNINWQEGATWSDLELTAKLRTDILWSYYEQFYQEVQWGKTSIYGNVPGLQPPEGLKRQPLAFIVPPAEQTDLGTMAKMLNSLSFQGVEISKSTGAFDIGGVGNPTCSIIANTCSTGSTHFATGTYVIRMDQPLRGYAKAEMEVQTYPVGMLNYAYAGGPAVGVVPYDVTSWTLPMAMGVTSYNVTDPAILGVSMSLLKNINIVGGIVGDPQATYGYAFSHKYNDAFTAMNRLFEANLGPLYIAKNDFTYGADSFSKGTVIVPQATGLDAVIADLATKLAVPFYRLSTKPLGLPVDQISKPKIGVLYTYSTSEPEGWTRWLLDHGVTGIHGTPAENEFDFVRLNPISIDTGFVNGTGAPLSSFNVLIIPPSVSLSNNSTSRAPGFQGAAYCGTYVCPNYDPGYANEFPYPGSQATKIYGQQLGITSYGLANLKNFMNNGGTIVLEAPSSTTAITNLGLTGFSYVSTGIPSYGGDGVMLKVGTMADPAAAGHGVTYGLPSTVAGFWENYYAFSVTAATPLAYYDATNPLMSGYLVDTGNVLNGKVAAVLVPAAVGTGRAIVFAFGLENRDKEDATFPFLFNSIYQSTLVPLAALP